MPVMTGSDPSEAKQTPWPLVFVVVGSGVVAASQIGKAIVALPILRAELHMSLVATSWVLSMFHVVGAIISLVIAPFVVRRGVRSSVLLGMMLMAAASAIGSVAPSASALLATRLIEGVGFIGLVVAAPSLLLLHVYGQDDKLAFGLWGAYMPAGQALALLMAPALLAPFDCRGLGLPTLSSLQFARFCSR